MMPGSTTSPRASISSPPPATLSPTATITPSSTATSASRVASVVTTVPPRMTRSDMTGEILEQLAAGGERCRNVCLVDVFVGMMADAARTADEQHRGGHRRREDHRIVPGAARHPVHGAAGSLDGASDTLGQRGIHRHGALIEMDGRLHMDLAAFAHAACASEQAV